MTNLDDSVLFVKVSNHSMDERECAITRKGSCASRLANSHVDRRKTLHVSFTPASLVPSIHTNFSI